MQEIDVKRLEYIVNSINGVSWEFDLLHDCFTYVSDNAEKVTSYPKKEWTDFASWAAMVHPDDREYASNYCANETKKKKNHLFEYRIVKKDGSVIWVLDIVSLGFDDKGNPITLFGTLIDVTERKELELQLKKERDYLRNILDSHTDATMIIRQDHSVEYINKAAKSHYSHVDTTHLTSLKCYEISHNRTQPCNLAGEECPLEKALQTKQPVSVLHTHTFGDKKQFVEVTASPLLDENGEAIGIIETAHNISRHIEYIQKLESTTQELTKEVLHDPLTQLPNRHYFEQHLQKLIDNNKGDEKIAIGYIDLDRFKPINDIYGHRVGDKVLQEIASRFRSVMRKGDFIARVGGDEFILIIPHLQDLTPVKVIANKILDVVEKPLMIDGKKLQLSCSIGFSIYPDDGEDVQQVIHKSDAAMYTAKHSQEEHLSFYEN